MKRGYELRDKIAHLHSDIYK